MEYITVEDNIPSVNPAEKLYCITRTPTTPRAVITIVHGLGEHSRRYDELADFLAKNGIIVRCFDHRGYGKSEGKRNCSTFEQMLSDMDLFCNQVTTELPQFLYGHSMGGELVSIYISIYEKRSLSSVYRGAIISSPYIESGKPLPGVKVFFGKLISGIFPNIVVDSEIKHDQFTHDPEEIKILDADVLMTPNLCVRLGTDLMSYSKLLMEKPAVITAASSVCMVHGTGDTVCSPTASEAYYETITLPDKTYGKFVNMRHECHHEINKQLVFDFLYAWINARIESTETVGSGVVTVQTSIEEA
jgi:alpha-beta hydrolase superfamily lysophospholipase